MATHYKFQFSKQTLSIFLLLLLPLLSLQAQNDFISTWKTDNPGTSNSTSITIPTHPSPTATYLYDVDWNNDGVYDEFQITGAASHDFGVAGTYTIRIRGEFPRIYFDNQGDKEKILDVSQWGAIEWNNMSNAFQGCTNLNVSATDAPDLSQVTDMKSMLKGCSNFNSPIEHWDVSTVESFYFTLAYCPLFNQPLNNWNTSSATNMRQLFIGCTNFDQPLNSWDVSNVVSFGAMFASCPVFNQSLSNWNVDNANSFGLMFSEASSFNGDISTWDPDSIKNIKGMFKGALVFNQDITHWDVSKVTNFENLFKNAQAFNQDIGNWDVSQVTNLSWAFASAVSFNQDIGSWDVSKVTNMNYLFFYADSFNQDISNWNVERVETMANMFKGPIAFNQDIGSWDVSNVTTMSSMFESNTSFDQNIGSWDVSQVTTMKRMFNLTSLSTENYDGLLMGWSELTLQDSVEFSAGNSIFCTGWSAREDIIATHNWIIDDEGHDQTAPSAICKEIIVQLDNNGFASISPEELDDGSYGFCTEINLSASQTTFDCNDLGELLDTLIVVDELGNMTTCVTNISVVDAATSFVCPDDITLVPNNDDCQASVEWEEPLGNCSLTVTSTHNSGDLFPLGTTIVTYTAIDKLQNVTTCSFNVTVAEPMSLSSTIIETANTPSTMIDLNVDGGSPPHVYDWNTDAIGDFDDPEDIGVEQNGLYSVVVKDNNECTATHEVSVILSSVATTYELHNFEISPNPNRGKFIVEADHCDGPAEIIIFNESGIEVFQTATNTCRTPIAVENLPGGVYFLKLSSRHGSYVKSFILLGVGTE